jgi:hypothetical protein
MNRGQTIPQDHDTGCLLVTADTLKQQAQTAAK